MPHRVLALDVFRGLVLFLLLPDLTGGFSLHVIARSHPDDAIWQALARPFQHVEWAGFTVWDLVMPAFVFMVGVSMGLSFAQRRRTGQTDPELLGHAAIRAAALLILGLLLQITATTRLEEVLPFLVLSIGLPVDRGWQALARRRLVPPWRHVDAAYAALVIGSAATWILLNIRELGHYEFGSQILTLMGLAYFPAFLLQRCSLQVQAWAIAAILTLYGMAFELFERFILEASAPDGPWQYGVNLAAALDRWLLPLLPRADPYLGNPHDYHTLVFVPLIAAIGVGAIVGRQLSERGPSRALGIRLCILALLGLTLSAGMWMFVSPLLKSLWTPTWSVFSSSVCLLLMGLLLIHFGDVVRQPRWVTPFVVLGANSMLLYVVAFTQRWRIVRFWDATLVNSLKPTLPWWPLLQWCLVCITLWAVATVLYRMRLFVRV